MSTEARTRYDRLEAEYGEADELPDEIDARLGEIELALETFERRPMTFEPDQISMAGVFISIDADGALLIERGYVRAEDETPAEPEAEIVDPGVGSAAAEVEEQVQAEAGDKLRTEELGTIVVCKAVVDVHRPAMRLVKVEKLRILRKVRRLGRREPEGAEGRRRTRARAAGIRERVVCRHLHALDPTHVDLE